MSDPKYDYKERTFTYEGKRYHVYGATVREAERKRAEAEAELKAVGARLDGTMTVRAWADEWMETYILPSKITAKSKAMYRQKLDNFILPAIGARRLMDVREPHLQRIVNEASSSKSTNEKVRLVLRRMFHQAVRARLIVYDPAEDLTLADAPEGEKKPITEYERTEILKLAQTHRAGVYVWLLYGCGLRPGEAAALRWPNVDLDAMELHVVEAVESGNKTGVKAPKTRAGTRTVPIPAEMRPLLEAARRPWSDYVLIQPKGRKRHTDSSIHDLFNSFKRALDIQMGAEVYRNKIVRHCWERDDCPETEADFAALTAYSLRHTYATDLQRAGVPLNVTRYLMGHSSVEVTAKHYIDTTPDVIAAAASSLAALRTGEVVNPVVNENSAPAQTQ